jgi:hypothetical protein
VSKDSVNALIHLVTECTMKSQLIMKELLLDDDERLQVGNNYNLGGENEEEEHKMNEE